MTALTWTDALALNQPTMDETHREFVDLLAACDAALPGEPAALLRHFDTLVAHTEAHFGQEDRWMRVLGFDEQNCHAYQHEAVLNVMRGCAERARDEGDFEPLKVAVAELATWFPQHAGMMDAGLAQVMAELGFDPDTGTCARPLAPESAHACGAASCTT